MQESCDQLVYIPCRVDSLPLRCCYQCNSHSDVVTNARRRMVLTAGEFVQEGRRQDVIDHPSGQEERQVILCAGHIQLEIIHAVQQALEALLHLVSLDDLVVQAGQQVCCHLVLPEEEEEEE